MKNISFTNPKRGAPGLSSMVESGSSPSKSSPSVNKKANVVAKPSAPSLAKETKETKASAPKYTSSSFKVGDNNYYIVDDSTQARNMIKWDDKGNIDPNSPIQVIGKKTGGGFVLSANESVKDVPKTKFPYIEGKGINFHSLESDKPGSIPALQNIHKGTFSDLSSVANLKAAAQLRGIYKRTGQF